MEYGLWNLPAAFWQPNNQNNVSIDNMGRPAYYATTSLPISPPSIDVTEGDLTHYAVTGVPCYRPTTDFLAPKNLLVGRPGFPSTIEDKSQLEGMLHIGTELLEPRSMESASDDSPLAMVSPCAASDQRRLRIRRASDGYEETDPPNEDSITRTNDYARQQGYQHPMYGMILNQIAVCKEERIVSENEEEIDTSGGAAVQPLQDATPVVAAAAHGTTPAPHLEATHTLTSDRLVESSRLGYECGLCGLVASTRLALRKHMAQAHPDQDQEMSPEAGGGGVRRNKPPTPSVLLVCPVASCRFRSADPLEMESHTTQHGSDAVNSEANAKKKICPISLQRVRYEREEYRCQVCSYSCTIEKAYHKHLKIHSMGLPPQTKISCVICGKDRMSEADMNKHMKKHRDDRYFCCDICIFKTVQLKKLIQHRRMHTGEKPHLCPHCSYRSARRDNLRSHVRRVHKKENLYCDTFSPRSVLLAPRSSATAQTSPSASNAAES